MQNLLTFMYRIVWSYWLHEDDKIVKVLGFKTALVDKYGQRRKMQPMIWRTIMNKYDDIIAN